MIGSISSGGGFGGLLGYLLAAAKDPEIIGGNVLGFKVAAIAREFHRVANKNPRVIKPVRHISISFAEEDGEINAVIKEEIAHEIMVEMGYLLRADELPIGLENNAQYLVVNHGRHDPNHDRSHHHDHFHIIANAVNLSGKWVSNSFDYQRLEKVLRKLEQKHGLRQIACSWEKAKAAPTHGQQQRWMKEKEQMAAGTIKIATPPVSEQLQDLIINVSKDQPALSEYLDRLAIAGVNVRTGLVYVSRRDRSSSREATPTTQVVSNSPTIGLSYEFQGVKFAASDLNASVNQLILRQRVTFDPVRDFPRLCRLESIEQSRSSKANLQRAIDYAAMGQPSMTIFAQRLQQMGVQPRFRITNNRQPNIPGDLRVAGVSYEINGQRWAGSQLLNASWPKLLAIKKISYSENADAIALYEASKGVDLAMGLEKIEIVARTPDFSTDDVVVVISLSERYANAPVDTAITPIAIVRSPKSVEVKIREIIYAESWDQPDLTTLFDRLQSQGVAVATSIDTVPAVSLLGEGFERREVGFSFELDGYRFDENQAIDLKTLLRNGRIVDQGQRDWVTISQLPSLPLCQSDQEKLQLILDLAAAGAPGVQTFVERLQLLGVRPHFEFDRVALRAGDLEGAVRGVSYQMGAFKATGGQLIDGSWRRLLDRRGIGFVAARDLPVLGQVNHGYDLSGAVPMVVLSSVQEEYLQVAAGHTLKLLAGRGFYESSRVVVGWEGEVLTVNRKRPEKTIFTAVLDEDSGRWMAIGATDITLSDVQLLERQVNGRKKLSQPGAGVEMPLEERSVAVQLEQGDLFRDVDQVLGRGVDR